MTLGGRGELVSAWRVPRHGLSALWGLCSLSLSLLENMGAKSVSSGNIKFKE